MHLIGGAGIIVRSKHIYTYKQIDSRVVGGGWVSWLHSVVSGSGLHISVLSHVTTVTADTYPASHWMVTMDSGNLLDTCTKALFVELVNTGQPPERKSEINVTVCVFNNIDTWQLTNQKVILSSRTVPSTVGSHNTDSVVQIVLSSHSDGGGCENSSRELGRR